MNLDRLHRAQAELAAAQQEVKKQEREVIEQQLREYTQKGRTAKELHESLDRQFYEAVETFNLAKTEVDFAESRIGRHQKPAITEFPTNEEIADWEREHARLIARRDRARTILDNAMRTREEIRLKALQANQELQGFERAVLRLTERLENY